MSRLLYGYRPVGVAEKSPRVHAVRVELATGEPIRRMWCGYFSDQFSLLPADAVVTCQTCRKRLTQYEPQNVAEVAS